MYTLVLKHERETTVYKVRRFTLPAMSRLDKQHPLLGKIGMMKNVG